MISLIHPLPDQLESLNWVVALRILGTTFYVKDSVKHVLTDRYHEACQFKSALSVMDEVLYWQNESRPGFHPSHRTAHFILQD